MNKEELKRLRENTRKLGDEVAVSFDEWRWALDHAEDFDALYIADKKEKIYKTKYAKWLKQVELCRAESLLTMSTL